jgi:ABC-2 type transport system ATP-binding protein
MGYPHATAWWAILTYFHFKYQRMHSLFYTDFVFSEKAVSATNLTKDYGHSHGVFDLNLHIDRGEIFGLIGPNGAGKSTFIKLLMDLIRPTGGSAQIFGLDTQRDSVAVKAFVGYLPGELVQFPGVTARYIIELLMKLRGSADYVYMNELAERLSLDLTRKYQDLSHGNKQKVAIIQSLVHKPDLLILDEPTLGLDPLVQREFRAIIRELSANGKTVMLSSHVLTEVESMCGRIGLIAGGRVSRVGTMAELRTEKIHRFSIVFEGKTPEFFEIHVAGVEKIEMDDGILRVEVRGPITEFLNVISRYKVVELDSSELSLEEVFFAAVGQGN